MKSRASRPWITGMLLAGSVAGQGLAGAQELFDTAGGNGSSGLGTEWVAVSPEELEELRGGYVMPSGLLMSFGIERAVYVDGQLVATTRFHVPDIANITPGQATALAGMQDTTLVQMGEGNSFIPGTSGGIVIQNSLDNLDIRALTTISVVSSTLGLFQDLNTNAALQGALLNAPGGY